MNLQNAAYDYRRKGACCRNDTRRCVESTGMYMSGDTQMIISALKPFFFNFSPNNEPIFSVLLCDVVYFRLQGSLEGMLKPSDAYWRSSIAQGQ